MAQEKVQLFGMSPPVNADEIAYGGGTVADALSNMSAVKSYTGTIATYGGNVHARRIGNVVQVAIGSIGTTRAIPVGTVAVTLQVLPQGYRPAMTIRAPMTHSGRIDGTAISMASMTSGGQLSFHPYFETATGRVDFTFLTTDPMPQ